MFFKRPPRFGENRQNQFFSVDNLKQAKFDVKSGVLKTSFARKQEESGVKYSAINQFIKGSTSGLEDKQFYFSLDSFSTKRNLDLG